MRLRAIALLLLFVASCAPVITPTPAPTQRLIAPTATNTPLPVTPSDTPTDLPAPQDLVTAVPAVTADVSDASLADPIAAEMVVLAQRRLGQELDLPTRRIRLVNITPITWPDTSLGCPMSGIEYESTPIDGYRLVLAAGENEYIFHSDFDRLVPCAANSEVLPDGVLEATAEATPE